MGGQRSAGQRITMGSTIPVDEYRERQRRGEREAQKLHGKCVNGKDRRGEDRRRERERRREVRRREERRG